MFTWYKNSNVQTKAMLSPGIILLLMLIIVGVCVVNLSSVQNKVDSITQDLAPDSNTAALILQEVYKKRLQVKTFIKTADPATVDKFKEAQIALDKIEQKANADFQNPARRALLAELNQLDEAYNQAFFDVVVPNMNVRLNTVSNNLNVNGPAIENLLSHVMASAYADGDAEASYYAGKALRSLLLARVYAVKFLNQNDGAIQKRVYAEITTTLETLGAAQMVIENPQRVTMLNDATALLRTYQRGFDEVVSAIETRNEAIDNILDVNGPKMAAISSQIRNSVTDSMNELSDNTNQTLVNTLTQVIGVAVVSLIVGVGVSIIASRAMVKPLIAASKTLLVMEQTGDLTQRLTVSTGDEIGQLAISFNSFAQRLQTLVLEISSATAQLSAASEEMSAVTEETRQQADAQSQETLQVASAVNELAATVKDVASNAESASHSTDEANLEAKSGGQVIHETVQAIGTMAGEVKQSASVIEKLKSDSQNISTVLDVIKSIAEQTNLLALNAAIEAARAGEQGRGFAVVADEVRTLAQKTQASTQEIENLIITLQSGADNAVNAMDSSKESIDSLVKRANEATTALDKITSMVGSISDMNSMIATAAEQQSVVVEQVNSSVHNIQGVSTNTAASSEQIAQASAELANLGAGLQEQVNQFKTA
ncbi:methyl-accepting chemotaxis protein [Alteromonas sp. C1M14]|uniref:methyl-accepting chemotaxis protein n=1 Tax=Alteromonas sp. C1M14 TaxID=2841567 RepID=UPI001C09B856|nr:methyl-accepting chemotaxis protein [Alteromonas sp. C1M14]MBU2976617.1 methyl-accepting chemotaxis protein [Alteromonas sp. C1M14]